MKLKGKYTVPLDVRYHPEKEEWEVLTEFWFLRPDGDAIKIPKGFLTDLASTSNVPLFPKDDEYNQAAVVHDFLYAAEIFPRPVSDDVFREALNAIPQVPWWKIPIMWTAVRMFGGITFEKHIEESIAHNRRLVDIFDKARPLWKDGKARFV